VGYESLNVFLFEDIDKNISIYRLVVSVKNRFVLPNDGRFLPESKVSVGRHWVCFKKVMSRFTYNIVAVINQCVD